MESLLSTCTPSINLSPAFSSKFPVYPSRLSNFPVRIPRFRLVPLSYKSSSIDFQDYAKPKRLVPSRKLRKVRVETLPELISSLPPDGSECIYKILLRTSSVYGSGLSDLNAGVLVCVIDENRDSILERIPALLCEDDRIEQSGKGVPSDHVHFDRGSIDEFVFLGPKLGRIQAMWISLESGTWRLGGASLMTINACNDQAVESTANGCFYLCLTYDFEVEDVLLGEGSDLSMAEFVPGQVAEYTGLDPFAILEKNVGQAAFLADKRVSNKDSMREYANLKYSLLLYDSILIFAGTIMLSATVGEDVTIAFFTGGIGGFLYLLLLQRSVDRLPAPDTDVVSHKSYFDGLFGEVKGPLLVLAFAFGVALLAAKHGSPEVEAALSPKEIIVGITGFLACKVSVWLAALKPLSISLEDNS